MRLKGILILSLLTTFHFAVKAQLPPATELSTLNGFNGFKVESLASNYFATSASNIGDINGDGIDDFAFGDTLSSFNNENDGAVHVIFGNNEPFQNTLNINSLNGSNGVTFVGEQAFGQAGWSVNSAGDINDDGLNDMIIGALTEDNGNLSGTGATYVVYGNSNGFSHPFSLSSLDGSNGFKVYGLAENDYIGRSVNTIGDINADNIGDVIICSGDISVDALFQAGVCYVLFGSPSISHPFDLGSLNGSNGFIIKSATAGERLGYASGSAGDFNNDGINDLYIGAGTTGKAYVIYGKSAVFASEFNLLEINGNNGFSVSDGSLSNATPISHAGDINHDGVSDIIIGHESKNNFTGSAYVLYGGDSWPQFFSLSGVNGSNGLTINGINENDMTGAAVSSAGDVNGDGKDDILIGSPGFNQYNGGAYVIYGHENLATTINLVELDGENASAIIGEDIFNGFSGQVVSAAGDINLDGKTDIIIGAPNSSRAYVVISNDVIFANGLELF
jgi:hypothetical protein